ncbi:MAG: ABC transporter permease, partial [Actinobacteria bacterium]|nr:ABC transporter permease [Actinomycetota bacterium]
MTYGLLAIGLILVYRSSRVVNFAHGQIGVVSAAAFALVTVNLHVPYYVALPFALGLGAAIGAGTEMTVIRRLSRAPRLMSIVATLGVGQFLGALTGAINTGLAANIPHPPGLPEFNLGKLVVTPAYTAILFFAPIVIVALTLFLRRSWFGVAIRSAADNPEAARMAGIRAGRMSALAWGLAGALSTFTAVLVLPARGLDAGSGFGPSLLLRALAVAVVARMNNLVAALIVGVGFGVVEQLLLWNYPSGGLVELVLFVTILVAMFFLPRQGARDEERGSWAAVEALRPIPGLIRQRWAVRNLGKFVGVAALCVAILVPMMGSHSAAISYTGMVSFAIIGLSVGVISGLGGQLSLGQFAIGAIGATMSFHVLSRTGNIALALVYAGIAGAIALVLVGLPSLRARGLMLTVTTLGFALVVPGWLLAQPWALGSGVEMGRPSIGGGALVSGRSYYFFSLGVFVVLFVLTRNLWSRGFGRVLRATRDNEDNARAFTISVNRVKVLGFAISGFIAAIGGAIYGHTLSLTTATAFGIDANINGVVIAVLGGLSILVGPILGVLYIIGIPTVVRLDAATLAASSFGWLVFLLYVPGGLAQLVQPLRDRIVKLLVSRDRESPEAAEGDVIEPVKAATRRMTFTARGNDHLPAVPGGHILSAVDLAKSYGGVV